jgi:peptidoglycan hydrolase-like protein with peptidoglycan-binding domain
VSRFARALGVITIPALTVPLAAAGADAATVPKPPTKALPSALDVAPPYQAQRLCDPTAKPGVLAFANLMVGHYKAGVAAAGISRNCNSGVTEHSEGRAWDWMLNVNNKDQKAIADSVTAWLSAPDAQGRPGAMARRFGIMYIIWNKKMWRAYDPARGWAAYSGSSPHTDHIAFSYPWDGAYGRTSWWTGKALTTISTGPATTPKPTTPPTTPSAVYSVLMQGATGADVKLAQKVIGVTQDGVFGPQTAAALRTWQGKNGVKVTGVLDAATWARMVALKLIPARPAATTPAPTPTPTPTPAPKPTTGNGTGTGPGTSTPTVPTTPTTTAPRLTRTVASTDSTTAYTALMGTTLKSGSRGEPVKVLQRALGGLTVDGAYGAKTQTAVVAFQKAHQLRATGVVERTTWTALERRDYPLKAFYGTVLRLGSTGSAVSALQKALRLKATGAYDLTTVAAVKAFQRKVKLASTGSVATLTWKAVDADLRSR